MGRIAGADDGTITVKPLAPELAGDFLAFFSHEGGPAFTDNPDWSNCYCQFYHTAVSLDFDARSGSDNRAAMAGRIATAEMEGFLAYGGGAGEVVGWLNAQPRHKLPHCFARLRVEPTPSAVPDFQAAQVLCFVVHPQWRRRGVARALLNAACAALARRGIVEIEAYPFRAGQGRADTHHFHGSLSMFLAAGFAACREEPSLTVVRKTLTPP